MYYSREGTSCMSTTSTISIIPALTSDRQLLYGQKAEVHFQSKTFV